jgi:Rrf2 family protein
MKALAIMAKQPSNDPMDIRTISKAAGIPPAYIAKIFQGLVRVGVVTSQRGPKGGYVLKKDPASITLLDVVNATDDVKNSPLSNCIMGLDRCEDENACMLHDIWIQSARRMKAKLQRSTVKDLAPLTQQLRPFKESRRILSRKIRAVFK